jgi:hypothetical protein
VGLVAMVLLVSSMVSSGFSGLNEVMNGKIVAFSSPLFLLRIASSTLMMMSKKKKKKNYMFP